MAPRALTLPLLLAIALSPAMAFAQPAPTSTAPTGTPNAPVATTPAPAPAPAGTGTPAPPPPKNEWGATWGSTNPAPPTSNPVIHHYYAPAGPTAVLPGFEALDSGASRFFVQLTKTVPVVEQKAAGTITYVLKGAHVNVSNNYHALVTVHFNTPAWRARLVPHGNDLYFVLELRDPTAKPTWQLTTPTTDGMTFLQIDFPSGSFLPSDAPSGSPGSNRLTR